MVIADLSFLLASQHVMIHLPVRPS